MISITHIINPVKKSPPSDLVYAQPIAFETMNRAKKKISDAEITFLTTQYEEDKSIIPDYFIQTNNLERSVLDLGSFKKQIKFPLIKDIIQKAIDNSDAEYIIYTNADIAVQQNFYEFVIKQIKNGHDAFIINRRRVEDKYKTLKDIEALWKDKGLSHPGYDCFVFHRSLWNKFRLNNVCVGIPGIGVSLAYNVFAFAENHKIFYEEHLTKHIGLEVMKSWGEPDYRKHNKKEFWKTIKELLPFLSPNKLPFSDLPFFRRHYNWLINPNTSFFVFTYIEIRNWFK